MKSPDQTGVAMNESAEIDDVIADIEESIRELEICVTEFLDADEKQESIDDLSKAKIILRALQNEKARGAEPAAAAQRGEREVEGLRKDAERWQFRRKILADPTGAFLYTPNRVQVRINGELISAGNSETEAIDAALAAPPPNEGGKP